MHFWQLPIAINEASRQKYASYTIHQTAKMSRAAKMKKKDNRNPFDCLNRRAHSNSKFNYNNIKSLQFSRSGLDKALDFSLLTSLPPITSVTAPRAGALKAYEQLHSFAKAYLRECGQEAGEELGQLRRLHGSISSLNGRMQKLCHSGVVVLDPVLNILFESLQAETALRQQSMHEAATHFRKAQFYSLKMKQYLFAGHCFIDEADIYKSQGRLERGLATLRKALAVGIECNNEELQLTVLQKMGMLYYYNGNTAAGEQYHRMAQRGLNTKEFEMFNQFSLNAELRLLQEELFSLAPKDKPTTKQFTRYDAEVNSDLQAESAVQRNCEVTAMVAHMLKDSREKTTGVKLKRHIKNTLSLATIIPHSQYPPPNNAKENLPFVNVSQVLKSHLSRNRGGTRFPRDWQIRTLLQMIDSLARCLP